MKNCIKSWFSSIWTKKSLKHTLKILSSSSSKIWQESILGNSAPSAFSSCIVESIIPEIQLELRLFLAFLFLISWLKLWIYSCSTTTWSFLYLYLYHVSSTSITWMFLNLYLYISLSHVFTFMGWWIHLFVSLLRVTGITWRGVVINVGFTRDGYHGGF